MLKISLSIVEGGIFICTRDIVLKIRLTQMKKMKPYFYRSDWVLMDGTRGHVLSHRKSPKELRK